MKLLLDTHTFIWWDSDPDQLSERASALCQDPENTILLSVVSVWEMHIKSNLGKLDFTRPLIEIVENQRAINQIEILPVRLPHVLALEIFPLLHKDPFDRLLIAQASVEQAVLLSREAIIAEYQIKVVW